MRAMKDGGVEWIGEIPEVWGIAYLFQFVQQVKNKNLDLSEKNLLSLSYGKIKRKDINTSEGLLPASFENYNVIEKNDIVLRLTDLQNDHNSLRVGLATERGIITSAYITLRPNVAIESGYLYYSLHTFDIVKGFYGMGAGVRQGLNYDEVKAIKIPLPPIAEQNAIAAYLDDKCDKIDSIITANERIIAKLKEYKVSLITETVTKGLNPDAEMKDSDVEWIGEIPEAWGVVCLKYAGHFENGLTYSPNDITDGRGILVLRSSNIQSGQLNFADCVYVSKVPEALMVKNNDIIICSRNGSADLVGKCAYVDKDIVATFGAFMMRYRATIFNRFAFHVLQAAISYYKSLFTTSTINQLTIKTIRQMKIPLPPLAEQNQIAAYLDDKCAKIDNNIRLREALIAKLLDYKKSLIYETVTGKKEIV